MPRHTGSHRCLPGPHNGINNSPAGRGRNGLPGTGGGRVVRIRFLSCLLPYRFTAPRRVHQEWILKPLRSSTLVIRFTGCSAFGVELPYSDQLRTLTVRGCYSIAKNITLRVNDLRAIRIF